MTDGGSSLLDPESKGLVGRVFDGPRQVMAGGSVVLVPAADVVSLNAKPVDISLSPTATAELDNDEPLEDLIDRRGTSYTRATVGADGVYRIPEVGAGAFFVVWVPDSSDGLHAPGGSECRVARAAASLVGQQLDLHISGMPTRRKAMKYGIMNVPPPLSTA